MSTINYLKEYYFANWPGGECMMHGDWFRDAKGRKFRCFFFDGEPDEPFPGHIRIQQENGEVQRWADPMEFYSWFRDRIFVKIPPQNQ